MGGARTTFEHSDMDNEHTHTSQATSRHRWDPTLYESRHAFVWQYGTDLIELLAPQPGERILDLGCGTGQLTAAIAARGAAVIGLDISPAMLERARQHYPELQFVAADATDFAFAEPFDAVFSNAVLHWINEPGRVAASVWRALKPGGRFVAEFGGKGNIQAIHSALARAIVAAGYSVPDEVGPRYFPSIGEYASLLERQGFTVTYAALFDRPTPLAGGEAGLRNWIAMFANDFFAGIPLEQHQAVLQHVEGGLRDQLWRDGAWVADYKRLRVVAWR